MMNTPNSSHDSLEQALDDALRAHLVRAHFAGSEHIPSPLGAPRSLEQVHARLAILEGQQLPSRQLSHRQRQSPRFWRHPRRYIPGLGVAIACGFSVFLAGSYVRSIVHSASSHPEASYSTQLGQRAVVSLADGSRVRLAPATTLEVGAGFGDRTRTVHVVGEAYFDVTDRDSSPFIVITPRATTRVLGTTFAVREYPTDLTTHVAVTSGKVSVGAKGRGESVVTAGMVAMVVDSGIQTIRPADITPYVAWASDRLVFRDAPVPEVFEALERWYGYRFQLADSSWMSKRLTLWLSADSSAAALRSLAFVLNADAHLDSNVVTLSPKLGHERRRERQHVPRTPSRREVLYSPSSGVGR